VSTSFESLSRRNTSSRTGFKPRLYLREVFVRDDLKMSEPMSTAVLQLQTKERKGGVVTLPEIVMVKRKSDCYELLPDHRLL